MASAENTVGKGIDSGAAAEDTVIVSSTLYNARTRSGAGRLEYALQSIVTARNLGYEMVIVDGGSSPEFVDEARRSGIRILPQMGSGMGSARRQAIAEALTLKRRCIAYLELEKTPLISSLHLAVRPILEGRADFVIPGRMSLASLPRSQQHSEALGNEFWRALTGCGFDMFFGPRVWKSELSSFFLDYGGEYGDRWECLFVPVLRAFLAGCEIAGARVDYTHPQAQTLLEEDDPVFLAKRIEQLHSVCAALEADFYRAEKSGAGVSNY